MSLKLTLDDGRIIKMFAQRILFDFDDKKFCFMLRILDFDNKWSNFVFDHIESFCINH